jgi:hypothetical protein
VDHSSSEREIGYVDECAHTKRRIPYLIITL